MFGWPSLSGMLKDLGNYGGGCDQPAGGQHVRPRTWPKPWLPGRPAPMRRVSSPLAGEPCKSQESSLALLWTLGIFMLNCGPVVMGLVLDFIGPKLTGILGGWRHLKDV